MGNQLTGIAPSQILPVEHYLTDVADYEFESSLGSTRFFKVARARFKEGETVVKVFVIQDPSLPIKTHLDKIGFIKQKLLGSSNCLPFQRVTISDKAVLLYRQFVKDSLYDRISTRPFLLNLDKKWLAFQLLCALNQCHKTGVCHGDIKSENVMVTGWNWVLLTDFASFKPTYLPEDNPSDFSYFFDTSRRRTCYIAPERFVESSWRNLDPSGQAENIDLTASEVKEGNLTPAMDIFSLGCVITELFTEGSPPFDLSELLSYITGEYTPDDVINKIDDPHIKELVSHMIQKDPNQRLSAEEYLVQQRGRAFPDYFYTFLKMYMQRFASPPLVPPDDRIHKIKKDFGTIVNSLGISQTDVNQNHGLILVFSMVTTSLRSLWFSHSKLEALELLIEISKHLPADLVLDRFLPYMLHLVNDGHPTVRAGVIRSITQCLANIKEVPPSDANVFPEYVLPAMSALTRDTVSQVRVAYAENIASLAETALRFLETVQLENNGKANESEGSNEPTSTYDMELQALQEIVQQKVSTLISDHDNEVKLTLLENGITPLCVFFGRQKANDVLLSHMITFLNDKQDWHLRGAFFDSIVGVAAYVGWQSSSILQPLLQQGLNDPEEFVIHKALSAMTSLTELGLLQKPILHEMLKEVIPFLSHPGVWVKQGAVGFIAAVSRVLNIADVHCNLLPLIKPFLKQPVIQVDQEVVILHALQEPVPRSIFDYVIRCQQIEPLFECLKERQTIRNMARAGHKPSYSEVNETMSQTFRKLFSMGLSEVHEDKLLTLKDFMIKIHRARAGSSEPTETGTGKADGILNLSQLSQQIQRRQETLDIVNPKHNVRGPGVPSKKAHKKKQVSSETMNEDWKQMFGSSSPRKGSPEKTKLSDSLEKHKGQQPVQPSSSPGDLSTTMTMSHLEVKVEGSKPQPESPRASSPPKPTIQARYTPCILSLKDLVMKKREEYANEVKKKEVLEEASWDKRLPPSNWKPQGLLVAHLHEHRAAVNRIQVSSDQKYFATCANDGSVKLWDCDRVEGKSVTNRSKQTYTKQGGQIKHISFCGNRAVAAASDNGTIHILEIDPTGNRFNLLQERAVDVQETGHVVDVNYYDSGSQSVLIYATVHGNLVGWDLRSDKLAWSLQNKPKHGLITSFDVHPQQNWLSIGTSSGTLICWDMRFQLPISSLSHPTGSRVRRLLTNPVEQSLVLCASQGNNEVSMWDMETGARQRTLWASSAPPLSLTQTSSHSVNGMCYGYTENSHFLLTAGSDMRIRFWDLGYPANSNIVAFSAADPINQTLVSYRSRIIDGTEVIQEMYSKRQGSGSEDNPRQSPDTPPPGHHDTITDVNMFQTTQCFMVTSSRDGVVKVWK